MDLSKAHVLPGCVSSVEDPEYIGRIKADVPTLFDSSKMNIDGLPWIYPCSMTGHQGFSTLAVGDMVWVIKTDDNYQEFWYIPMYQQNDISRSIMADDENYEDSDIVYARQVGDDRVCMYNNVTDGTVIQINNDKRINIHPTDGMTLRYVSSGTPHQITLSNNGVVIGNPDEESDNPAVKYKELSSIFGELQKQFLMLSSVAASNIMTTPMAQPLYEISKTYAKITKTACSNTFVN